ncbi:hypothetical protein ACF0H5_007295 [Mactra antiquata]
MYLYETIDHGDSASNEEHHTETSFVGEEGEPLLVDSDGGPPTKLSPGKAWKKTKSRISKERLMVVGSVLVTELCERMTYYSVMANMVLYCTSILKYSSDDASLVALIFGGTVYLIPVIGGYIADAFAGKYNTIFGSGLLYLLGLFLLPASAIDYPKWFGSTGDLSIRAREAFFFTGLIFIAMGTGGIKANVGPFGAQQVDDLGAEAVQSFFNWFYWFINAGAVVAYSGVAYVQQEIGFDVGFLIPLGSMVIALIIFAFARKKYVHRPPGGSILFKSIDVCCAACNKHKNPSWHHASKRGHSDEFILGVRAAVGVIPVFVLIIVYWAVYNQMSTSLFLQSERMNLYLGSAKMPAAILNIFNTIIILILIPIMDRVVYPCLAKFNKSPTHLQRIGIGMVLAACAMLYSGMIEIVRKDELARNGGFTQELAGSTFNASNITMFAQVPEFAFIGASEVFTSISGLEFAYTQAPAFMQGLLMGMFLMTSGLGGYLASAIVGIVSSWRTSDASDWYPKEPNHGHLEYILFLLAGLTIVNLAVFVMVAKQYKYKKPAFETIISENEDEVAEVEVGAPELEHKPRSSFT